MRKMKNNLDVMVLKGLMENARYTPQELEEYENNPFIEALPSIFTEDDIIERFSITPSIGEKDKQKPSHIRYHIIKRIKNFVQPLPIHFTIERRLSNLIRRGYLARNPIDRTYLERLRVLNDIRNNDEITLELLNERMNYIRSTADSLAILGISGIGKTTAIERLLLMYPQVIRHSEYNGEFFSRTQIVWLKIDCPYDGSLSTLCKSFFKAIDDLIGTRYLEKYGYANRVTSTMMLHMTTLASIYGIGVLVIDEIQNLLNAKNDMEDMLNFFVTLSNTVGIPTVLIGTSKAQRIFKGNFRQARRAASEGAIMWDRMSKDDMEWEFFIETLWEYQCLKEYVPLGEEIKNAFYDETQGITYVAVALFILAQERALSEEKEKLSISLIRRTAKEDLKMIQPMIKALRKNNINEIRKYEDISISLDEIATNYKRDIELVGHLQDLFKERKETIELKKRSSIENLTIELSEIGIFDELNQHDFKKVAESIMEKSSINEDFAVLKSMAIKKAIEINDKKKSEKLMKQSVTVKEKGLISIYDMAIKRQEHPYEALKREGYIKDPIEEFLKVE